VNTAAEIRRWQTAPADELIRRAANRAVDIRLIIFAACQVARSTLPYTMGEAGAEEAEDAIEVTERWVADESSVQREELRDAADLVDEVYRHDETIRVAQDLARRAAFRSAALCAYAAYDAVRSWRAGANLAWQTVESASEAHRLASSPGRFVDVRQVVRTVIPYPRAGQLVAMGPGFYVVRPPSPGGPSETQLGLQQAPRKVSGKWWDGYIEGPIEDVIQAIPNEITMREVYERVVVQGR
jgi:hypothetical protein